ncbi:MAG: DUF5665 domain-containing protein [Firmicutes bacterium]|nr:DUF5665 domain-containing protein [Bacillota bacterium]
MSKGLNKVNNSDFDKQKQIAMLLGESRLGEYVEMMSNSKEIIKRNFIAGLARGLGMAIGFTVLGALVLYILQKLVVLNLPFFGNFIAEIVKIVQDHL